MAWITQRQRIWRLIFLLLLTAAILGPWRFDLIHVPSPHTCSAPNIRLSEDFCGIPVSIITHITVFVVPTFTHFQETTAHLAAGEINPLGFFLFHTFPLLLLLPLLTAIILSLGGRWRWQLIHLEVVTLAASMTLFLGIILRYSPWLNWGLWLYLALALGALILELMVRRANQATKFPALTGGGQ
jgi:hypothetical protein